MPKKLPEGEGKRIPLNMRTTRETRDRLEKAAEQSGRSLAQELEIRLERSFEFQSVIEQTIEQSGKMFADATTDLIGRYQTLADMNEKHLIEVCGGDDLFLFWGALAEAIHRVERERGKSIRDDQETRDAAERELLGEIPRLFRQIPESYSSFKARIAATPPDTGPLAQLARAAAERRTGGSKKQD